MMQTHFSGSFEIKWKTKLGKMRTLYYLMVSIVSIPSMVIIIAGEQGKCGIENGAIYIPWVKA